VLEGVYFFRTSEYFGQFHSIQLDSQLSCQTLKLRTAAFSVQQLSLHSSFPCIASHTQPKQTGPRSVRSRSEASLLLPFLNLSNPRYTHLPQLQVHVTRAQAQNLAKLLLLATTASLLCYYTWVLRGFHGTHRTAADLCSWWNPLSSWRSCCMFSALRAAQPRAKPKAKEKWYAPPVATVEKVTLLGVPAG
jgi:hypothetical protein